MQYRVQVSLLRHYVDYPAKIIDTTSISTLILTSIFKVIDQQDDDDLHPYGRGGIYHNIIYGRNVKVKYDYNKMFIWLLLIFCLLLGAGAIIFASGKDFVLVTQSI